MPDSEERFEGRLQQHDGTGGVYDVLVTEVRQRGAGSWEGRIRVNGGGIQNGVLYRLVLKDGRQAVGQVSGQVEVYEAGGIAHGGKFIADGPFV